MVKIDFINILYYEVITFIFVSHVAGCLGMIEHAISFIRCILQIGCDGLNCLSDKLMRVSATGDCVSTVVSYDTYQCCAFFSSHSARTSVVRYPVI